MSEDAKIGLLFDLRTSQRPDIKFWSLRLPLYNEKETILGS